MSCCFVQLRIACEAEAKAHIRDKAFQGPPVPVAGHPEELRWENEAVTGFDERVEYIARCSEHGRQSC
ncbi:hypothetical protein ACODNH_00005, partial (plasmid) [Haloarcula sp. NS06]